MSDRPDRDEIGQLIDFMMTRFGESIGENLPDGFGFALTIFLDSGPGESAFGFATNRDRRRALAAMATVVLKLAAEGPDGEPPPAWDDCDRAARSRVMNFVTRLIIAALPPGSIFAGSVFGARYATSPRGTYEAAMVGTGSDSEMIYALENALASLKAGQN